MTKRLGSKRASVVHGFNKWTLDNVTCVTTARLNRPIQLTLAVRSADRICINSRSQAEI
jgi:hypothetical protein